MRLSVCPFRQPAILGLLGSLAHVGACADTYSAGSSFRMDPAELARLGVPTDAIDNGDGTWSMPVPQDFRPDELVEAGDMTWRYVGQGRYDLDPSGPFGELSYHYERPKFETTAEQLLVTQREDDLGRLWEVDSVDESKLSSTRVPSDYELMEADDDEPPEPQPGDELWWEPTSWIHQTCAGGWDVDIWDTDDRVEKPSPSGIRQQAMVQVTWSASGETGACSAVLLRNRWVLTAAHCLHKSNGTNVANSNITVWLLWANESRGVVDKFIADGYNYSGNGWDPDDDYALLKISSTFNSSPPDMDISSASDSDLNAVGANFHNLAYPPSVNVCATNTSDLTHWDNGDITGKSAQTIRWKGDGGDGHSGGPLYFCPGAPSVTACDSDDIGNVVAVWAGWSGYYDRLMGARGSNFVDWATDIMDNN